MKRNLTALLLVVVLLFSFTYAAADDLDLTQMTTSELESLRDRINEELKNRPKEEVTKTPRQLAYEIADRFQDWANAYDFDSILAYIETGNHGLSEKCAEEIKANASSAKALLDECTIETDPFTDQIKITHNQLGSFANGCQAFPYIDGNGFALIVGFPYEDSLHYDQVFLKSDKDITEIDRFSRDGGFDIQFEIINGNKWEYSTLTNLYIDDESIEAISFREDGSIRKENYELTAQETKAISTLYKLADLQHEIYYRVLHWSSTGE